MVDGQDQAESSGHLLTWQSSAHTTRAVASAPGAFAGVDLHRHLVMKGEVLLDAVHVRADEARALVLGLRPADRLDASEQDGLFHTTWRDGGAGRPADRGRDLHGCHLSSAGSIFGWTPVRGPSDDPARVLGGIDWSAECAEIWFVSLYQPASGAHSARPRLRILSSTADGLEVEATTADGRTFIVPFQAASDEESSRSDQRRTR